MLKIGVGGNFISSRQTKKLFRNAYHVSTIFPRLSLEKWQESNHKDATKFLRERTIDLLNQSNFPDDQIEMLKKGEFLISKGNRLLL
jgi:trimethylamine:corrinoid methyltransferase-like protein